MDYDTIDEGTLHLQWHIRGTFWAISKFTVYMVQGGIHLVSHVILMHKCVAGFFLFECVLTLQQRTL